VNGGERGGKEKRGHGGKFTVCGGRLRACSRSKKSGQAQKKRGIMQSKIGLKHNVVSGNIRGKKEGGEQAKYGNFWPERGTGGEKTKGAKKKEGDKARKCVTREAYYMTSEKKKGKL